MDFTKKDSYSVGFGEGVKYLKGLAIEPSLKDLDCINQEIYLHCTIPKSYFKGQKTGYYYVYQNNSFGTRSPEYEIGPIKVVMADDSKNLAEKINTLGYMFPIFISFILFWEWLWNYILIKNWY